MRRITPLLALLGVAAALLSPQEAAAHPERPGRGTLPVDAATAVR
jgi:hypothetical protein